MRTIVNRLVLAALLAAAPLLAVAPPAALAQPAGEEALVGEAPAESASAEPIDLNRATAEELQALPGIGPTRARAIVALRERLGGFRHVRQLLRVRGIGRATFRRIRPLVTVGPVPSARAERNR